MMAVSGTVLHDSFSPIIAQDGKLRIAGFGSLLSGSNERSARTTFPDLEEFQIAKINGYRRVFAHSASVFLKRGIASVETGEISSVAAEPTPDTELIVTYFSIKATTQAIQNYIEREHEFKFVAVECCTLDGQRLPHLAVLCCRWNDEDYRATRCPDDLFQELYGQYGITRIYRDDILPCRVYLRHCVLAAQNLDPEIAYNNFLDTSYLADRKTTIRTYIEKYPDIMLDRPPIEHEDRYSG